MSGSKNPFNPTQKPPEKAHTLDARKQKGPHNNPFTNPVKLNDNSDSKPPRHQMDDEITPMKTSSQIRSPPPPGTNVSNKIDVPGTSSDSAALTRQLMSGKFFKKCKSATFQIDGATYTIVASPPDRRIKDDSSIPTSHASSRPAHPPVTQSAAALARNGQLPKQGSLTIVRRSSGKKNVSRSFAPFATSPGDPMLPSPSAGSSAFADDDALDAVDLATDNLPAVDTPDACDKAAIRLRCLLRQLQRGEISAELLQKNLHYAARVLEAVFIDETKRLADEDDELSEVQPDAVPPEVREWLASTFTRQMGTTRRRADEKPKFRTVAHAIRAGIFVDRMYRKVATTPTMIFPQEVVKVLKTLDDWSFDVFALSEASAGHPIKYLGYDLLNRYGIIHKFKVQASVLEVFLTRIEEGYCRFDNPYHNNLHGADVAQTMHHMLCQTGLMNWLSDLEIFSTLIAAIIHDFEHTGTTNNFHVMSGSETALLYNDRAVLENHHISASFRLMRDDDCNIIQHLTKEEFREFRTLVIDMVLATDMSQHFQQLKTMRSAISLADPVIDKSKALGMVVHMCDISHPAKQWDIHYRWTKLLLEEFFRQGDKEQEMGLPFSPLCDRNNTHVAESQIGFIEFIVEPSMNLCADMLDTILRPIHKSCGHKETDSQKQEDSEFKDNPCKCIGSKTITPDGSPRFHIKRPWTKCMIENKVNWKEKATKETAIREELDRIRAEQDEYESASREKEELSIETEHKEEEECDASAAGDTPSSDQE